MPPREWDERGNPVGPQEWDENGRPIDDARERQLTRNYTPLGGALASLSQGATFGFSDEMEGGLEAIRQGTGALLRGQDVGAAAQQGYRDARDTTRAFVARNRDEAPIMSAINEVGGGLFTGGAGAAQAAPATGRGIGLLVNQMARGSAMGGASGYAYGLGTGEGDDRIASANRGAVLGAAVGGIAPPAVNAAGAIVRPIVRAGRRVRVDPSRVGTMGGNITLAPGRAPVRLTGPAAGTIDRMADRAGMTPDQVAAGAAAARRVPQGQVLADLFDESGRVTTRALAQWPGQTGQRARVIARDRASQQPTQIMRSLREGLGVGETRQTALSRLETEYRRMSAELYQPLFRARLSSTQQARFEGGLQQIEASPTVRRAMARANELFADESASGLVQGGLNDNRGRYVHYLKLALDDIISQGRRDGSLVGNQMRATIELRNRVRTLLDDNLPGYGDARRAWGGVVDAEEALAEGADFLARNPEDVRRQMASMTPFERIHARIGLVDEIAGNMRGGRVVGAQNVANALDFRDTQDIIAATFDSPQQAAEFLDVLNTSNQLMRNATTWGGGSSTAANAAHGADEALNVAGDMTGSVLTGSPGGAVARGVRGAVNAVTMGRIERANNQRGEALLARVDNEDSKNFMREVVEELRRRAALRATNSRVSAVATGGGAAATNRN